MPQLLKRSTRQARLSGRDEVEVRAADHLVALIDVLLALMLVEGAVFYRSVFRAPSHANLTVVVAMALVYYTAIRSFIDWHLAMEAMPYRVLTDSKSQSSSGIARRFTVRRTELLRVLLDFAIMGSYSFLLLRCHTLIVQPHANLFAVALAYVVIYGLYTLWGAFLRSAYPEEGQQFSLGLPLLFMVLAGALALGYGVGRPSHWFFSRARDFNTLFLSLELFLVIVFRELNWLQQIRLDPPPIKTPAEVATEVAEDLSEVAERLRASSETVGEAKRKLQSS